MVFGLAQLISYISRYTVLQPGDVVLTGSPRERIAASLRSISSASWCGAALSGW